MEEKPKPRFENPEGRRFDHQLEVLSKDFDEQNGFPPSEEEKKKEEQSKRTKFSGKADDFGFL